MKQSSTNTLLLISSLLILSCSKPTSPANPDGEPGPNDPAPKAYTIQGSIKDAAGNAIPGARIRVENPNGNNIHYTTTSDNNGKYAVTVSAIGGYHIYAWKETTFENETYQVRLGMEKETDYNAFSVPANGVTKNFVWKLDGRIPDRTVSKENGTGYFGGTIKFINYNSLAEEMSAGTEVTITLTPLANAKYLDGTSAAGKVITKKFTIVSGVAQAYYINDIPATKYSITASSAINGINRNVSIGDGNPDVFTANAAYYFKSEGGSGSYENGLGSPNENYFYLMNQ